VNEQRAISIWSLIGALAASLVVALCTGNAVLARSNAESRGAELFAAKGCAHCHGPAGVGGGKGPDLQTVRKRRSTESIITQIHDGGKAMPPFGDKLSAGEIKDLAAFLRAKRKVLSFPSKPSVKPSVGPADKSTNGAVVTRLRRFGPAHLTLFQRSSGTVPRRSTL